MFLNETWDDSWGGSLELHRDPRHPANDRVVSVAPLVNRAVLFETSERSWHGFRRITAPEGIVRRSIAVYFYTKDRPAEESEASHGTFYVQRQLPEHIRAGYTLTEQDVREVQALISRRDTMIEYLYQRELAFSKMIHSPSGRLARALTWPMRKLLRRG